MDLNTLAVGILSAVIMALILTVLFAVIVHRSINKENNAKRITQRAIIASSLAVIIIVGIGLLIVLT